MSVVDFDKQVHPRYKVCGGGLSARIERILPADFKTVVDETVYRVQFTYEGTDSFIVESPQPVAYMVMRQAFDRWLVEKARQGELLQGRETYQTLWAKILRRLRGPFGRS